MNKIKNKLLNKYRNLKIEDFVNGILNSDRSTIAKAITLVESNSTQHKDFARTLIEKLYDKTGKSIRIGISGSPGVGKSTFIESFGLHLCEQGLKLAVLAIDPSSKQSKGSILGDKTRMEKLSQNKNSFIRPSPSGNNLGGVSKKTKETILICEAAGFDVIIVETIGVGQSEIAVRTMVDFFLLLLLPNAGDELQGIKKGTVEIADLIVVNKADGNNSKIADFTLQSYKNAVHFLLPATPDWTTKVLKCSALNRIGIEEIWKTILDFLQSTQQSGFFDKRRSEQQIEWIEALLKDEILDKYLNNEGFIEKKTQIENEILKGKITPTTALEKLLTILEIN